MNLSLQAASAPLQELRRRIAGLFGAAEIHELEADRVAIGAQIHSLDLAAQSESPRWGEQSALMGPDDCAAHTHAAESPDSVLVVQLRLRGGPDSDARPAAPAVLSAFPELPAARPIPLFTSLDRQPQVIQPPIARPSLPCVIAMPVVRIEIPASQALQAEKIVVTKPRRADVSFKSTSDDMNSVPMAIAYRSPMERQRLPMPPKNSMQEEFVYMEERKALAAANDLELSEIRLVGVYLDVPLGAASHMEFDEATGSLLLTLRENASNTVERLKRPVVTLVLGKVKATGRVVRAFM